MNKAPTLRKKDRFIIIMAGGRGERFWPVSREKRPKQLISLFGKSSFLQETVARIRPLVPMENIYIITNAVQATEVRRQLPRLPRGNVVAEPCGRDTCPAVTLGAALVGARSTSGVMAVLPADHLVPDAATFRRVLGDAFELAAREASMVTIGIKPNEPATAYGYIRVGDRLPSVRGVARLKTAFFKAKKFVEKPSLEKAKRFLSSGRYRWNAGMFVWSVATITAALEKHQPAQNVVVADGSFAWDDLGSWPALARHLNVDDSGNCVVGEFLHVDSARNIIYDARVKNRTPIAAVGMSDMILVLTDDATLVADRSQSQKIKDLVGKLSAHPRLKKLV